MGVSFSLKCERCLGKGMFGKENDLGKRISVFKNSREREKIVPL